jgi:hypothetical protein
LLDVKCQEHHSFAEQRHGSAFLDVDAVRGLDA